MKKLLIGAGLLVGIGYLVFKAQTTFSIESVDFITKEVEFIWHGKTYVFNAATMAQTYPSGDTILNVYVSGDDVYFDQFRDYTMTNRRIVSLTQYSQLG